MSKPSRARRLLIGLAVLLLALAGYVLYALNTAGEFKTLEPHFDGSCQRIPSPVGAEDFALLADRSALLISSDDRRASITGDPKPGAIFLYDLKDPRAAPINLTPGARSDFHPHGIALHQDAQRTTLFVVNHPGASLQGDSSDHEGPAHSIEVYAYKERALTHLRSVTDAELLISPNDVAPIDHQRFYVTNDHGSGDPLVRKLEDYLRIPRAHVLFYDGSAFARLPGNYRYANGVTASADRRQIYLSAPTEHRLYVFDRKQADSGTLSLRHTIELGTGPDNITLDAAGDLWIGAHPKMLTFVRHAADAAVDSPSQVLRLRKDKNFAPEEVFLSMGDDLSASTVALRIDDRLLIGSVFEQGFLDCRMSRP